MLELRWQLRTGTGDVATVREAHVLTKIGATKIKHHVLVADIEKDVILEMDIMHVHGFELDLRERILGTENEELILHPKEDVCAQMLLAEDVTVPPKSKALIVAKVKSCFEKVTLAMLEPPNKVTGGSKEVLVAKALVVLCEEVLVQIMNINSHPVM